MKVIGGSWRCHVLCHEWHEVRVETSASLQELMLSPYCCGKSMSPSQLLVLDDPRDPELQGGLPGHRFPRRAELPIT